MFEAVPRSASSVVPIRLWRNCGAVWIPVLVSNSTLSAICPQNLILECRHPWCLSNFGRFLLVADHYSTYDCLFQILLGKDQEKTGSFFPRGNGKLFCFHRPWALNFFCQLHTVTLTFKFQRSFEECHGIKGNLEHLSAELQEVCGVYSTSCLLKCISWGMHILGSPFLTRPSKTLSNIKRSSLSNRTSSRCHRPRSRNRRLLDLKDGGSTPVNDPSHLPLSSSPPLNAHPRVTNWTQRLHKVWIRWKLAGNKPHSALSLDGCDLILTYF